MISASVLHGIPKPLASLMGMPHVGAYYRKEDYNTQTIEPGARCVLCGRRAIEAHHVVPRGELRGFTLNSQYGRFVLLSPLFAVCRSCHELFPSGYKLNPPVIDVEWVWDSKEFETNWWNGYFLSRNPISNNPELFSCGHYILTDKRNGTTKEIQ